MKTFIFSETVMLDESEYRMLKEIANHTYVFNFDGPDTRLELCDSLVGKGLCTEDSDGRVSINNRGRKFLESAI